MKINKTTNLKKRTCRNMKLKGNLTRLFVFKKKYLIKMPHVIILKIIISIKSVFNISIKL